MSTSADVSCRGRSDSCPKIDIIQGGETKVVRSPSKCHFAFVVIFLFVAFLISIISIIVAGVAFNKASDLEKRVSSLFSPPLTPPSSSNSGSDLPGVMFSPKSTLVFPIITPRLAQYGAQGTWKEHPQNTPGFRLIFPDPTQHPLATSPTWSMAGWTFRFIQIPPSTIFEMPSTGHENYICILQGSLLIDNKVRAVFPLKPSKKLFARMYEDTVQSLGSIPTVFWMLQADPQILATPILSKTVPSFSPLRNFKILGTAASYLEWFQYNSLVGDCGEGCNNDVFNMRGFEIYSSPNQTAAIRRIAYLQFWAAGTNTTSGWRDPSSLQASATFGGLAFCLATGHVGGGFQWKNGNDSTSEVMQVSQGEIIGPLYETDGNDNPLKSNGVIQYRPYRWKTAPGDGRSMYDLWATIDLIL